MGEGAKIERDRQETGVQRREGRTYCSAGDELVWNELNALTGRCGTCEQVFRVGVHELGQRAVHET